MFCSYKMHEFVRRIYLIVDPTLWSIWVPRWKISGPKMTKNMSRFGIKIITRKRDRVSGSSEQVYYWIGKEVPCDSLESKAFLFL